jgi:hypothetical protein
MVRTDLVELCEIAELTKEASFLLSMEGSSAHPVVQGVAFGMEAPHLPGLHAE